MGMYIGKNEVTQEAANAAMTKAFKLVKACAYEEGREDECERIRSVYDAVYPGNDADAEALMFDGETTGGEVIKAGRAWWKKEGTKQGKHISIPPGA